MAEDGWTKSVVGDTKLWNFETDGTLVGILTSMKENVGPNNSKMYSFRLEDGDLVSLWGSTLIDQHLVNIALGEEVKIVYKGKKKSPKTNRDYKDYDIFHRPVSQ